jgi:hypothetical protein
MRELVCPGLYYPYNLWLVFTAIECASRTLRLQMPSRNNVETMFVQHSALITAPEAVKVSWQARGTRSHAHSTTHSFHKLDITDQ